MKNYFKTIILLLGILLTLSNCEENESLIDVKNEKSKIKLTVINKNDFTDNYKLIQNLNKFESKKTSLKSKKVYNSIYNFTINTNSVTYIEKDNLHSYTFSIYRDDKSDLNIENLVLSLNENGEYDAIIVNYDFSINQLKSFTQTDLELREVTYNLIDFDSSELLNKIIEVGDCIEYWTLVEIDQGDEGELVGAGNEEDPKYEWVLESRTCFGGGGGGDPTDNPENTIVDTGTGGTISNNNGSYGNIITSPTNPDGSSAVVDILTNFLSLTPQQSDYLSINTNIANETFDFLEQNRSINGKNFAKEAIEALIRGDYVDFKETYIETKTPDDGYTYTGTKQLIPNPLTLSNGDQVSLQFGTTKSDNKNANQEVSIDLIAGIKDAIEQANFKLSASEKITSIYIMATTNGKHSPTSNHSNGTAIDISRINGVKMSLSGVTNQITELQKGFDGFIWIRENFGPAFKHKYYNSNGTWDLNYNIGGHKYHIHVSIRK